MNRDVQVEKGSDYLFRFEFLGENNAAYAFDSDDDWLQLELEDVAGNCPAAPIIVPLEDIENPVTIKIPWSLLDTFKSNPIKYKLVLSKSDLQLVLLSGYIQCL